MKLKIKYQKFQKNQRNLKLKKKKKTENKLTQKIVDKGPVPLYIGVLANKDEEIKNYIKQCLTYASQIQNTDKFLTILIKQYPIEKIFQFTKHFHVTMLFMRRDQKNNNHPIYRDLFDEGKQVNLRIQCIVIVNYKLMCAPIFFENEKEAKSDNEFPHITLMIGEWKPVQSNDVLKLLFNKQSGVLKDYYQNLGSQGKHIEDNEIKNFEISFKGKKETGWIIRTNGDLRIQGTMKKFES